MENCPGDRRCLICRRPTLENPSLNSEKLVSNVSLLQDFLNCFHINVLDTDVSDLSTSCQFCPSCEQFIAEWSNIQTQMTQLTRRAAQIKATLSALLLSAPRIQERNQDEEVTEIINNGIPNSQEVQLQQTVHDIRSELQKKYSVSVMLDKIPVPSVLKLEPLPIDSDNDGDAEPLDHREIGADNSDERNNIPLPSVLKLEPSPVNYDNVNAEPWDHWECEANIQLPAVPKIDPLSVGNDNDDEPWDQSGFGEGDSDEEYLPSEDELSDEETPEEILGIRMETEAEDNCDESNSQDSGNSKEINAKAGNSETIGFLRKGDVRSVIIPVGPNTFKYNGCDIRLNDEDQCYYCGVCNFNCGSDINNALGHIRETHYTAEAIHGEFQSVHYTFDPADNKFICGLCETRVPTWNEFGDHILLNHRAPPPPQKLPCAICGAKLSSERHYRMHIERHQTASMKCPTCSKQFRKESSFKKHMELHELGEDAKKYQCDVCGKKFLTANVCRNHQRLHTGEKPYECQICGEKFGHSGHLSRHRKSAHGIQPKSRVVIKL